MNFCFEEESLELNGEYIERCSADVLLMGDDWKGVMQRLRDAGYRI